MTKPIAFALDMLPLDGFCCEMPTTWHAGAESFSYARLLLIPFGEEGWFMASWYLWCFAETTVGDSEKALDRA
ncbi:hypothetical protein TNCT_498321 [Trichonephila clavata]|uniref:Uncharacterized protein n=1 Tax=Trichonephila clavata TaxID=2740835 RepID=A0A8X6GWY4_TRICU|nr:hypothetical protein TNCT_498321 [Trichonephila clavata]